MLRVSYIYPSPVAPPIRRLLSPPHFVSCFRLGNGAETDIEHLQLGIPTATSIVMPVSYYTGCSNSVSHTTYD
jgi:hypothetical protein